LVFFGYWAYWNEKPFQFIRVGDHKLYRDGRFYEVPQDLKEDNDLATSTDEATQVLRQKMEAIMATFPPAPLDRKGNKNTKERPLYPAWKRLIEQ